MIDSPPWLSHPVVQRILHKFLDMTDKVPIGDRMRRPSFRVNAKTLPELFQSEKIGEAEYAWGLVTEMERQGWITLKRQKRRPGYAEYETKPLLYLNIDAEPVIRKLLGRHASDGLSETERWRNLVAERSGHFPGKTDWLAAMLHRVLRPNHTRLVDSLLDLVHK